MSKILIWEIREEKKVAANKALVTDDTIEKGNVDVFQNADHLGYWQPYSAESSNHHLWWKPPKL